MGEWRYYNFTSNPKDQWPYAKDLIDQLKSYYDAADDSNDETCIRAETIYQALCSNTVSEALEKYKFKLAYDFELGVFDPDNDSKGNYCS